MTDQQLGRLDRVDLRDIWISEAAKFTPWLARPENIAMLGEALGIDLELEAQEKAVWPFRADILCKVIGTGESGPEWVVVRAVRYPRTKADLPTNWQQIAARCAELGKIGHFASFPHTRSIAGSRASDITRSCGWSKRIKMETCKRC